MSMANGLAFTSPMTFHAAVQALEPFLYMWTLPKSKMMSMSRLLIMSMHMLMRISAAIAMMGSGLSMMPLRFDTPWNLKKTIATAPAMGSKARRETPNVKSEKAVALVGKTLPALFGATGIDSVYQGIDKHEVATAFDPEEQQS